MSNSGGAFRRGQHVWTLAAGAIVALTAVGGCSSEPESVAKIAARGTSREMFADSPTARRAIPNDRTPETAPRASVLSPHHDFGEMSPFEVRSHVFHVRNHGDAPLTIEEGLANCKCTTSRLPEKPIPPGEEGEIEVQWTVRSTTEAFDQTAEYVTNDPKNRRLELRLTGRVLGEIYVDPPYFDAERSRPDQARSMAVTISSPLWDGFEVLSATPSLEGVECRLTPIEKSALPGDKTKSAWRLEATLPQQLPPGRFRETVSVQLQPNDALQQPRRIEIPIVGSVLRQVAVYGKGIDGDGVVRFGVLEPLEEHRLKFLVKVHDSEPDLRVQEIKVSPEFLQVRLEPFQRGKGGGDLYHLDVIVPASAPPSVHQGNSIGQIELVFDHPRLEPLNLAVDFSVRPYGPARIASAAAR